MKKIEFELDAAPNISKYILLRIVDFFVVPYQLFSLYYAKFKIKKTSKFFKYVDYPLSNLIFKYLVFGIIFAYILYLVLYIYGFDEQSIFIYTALITSLIFLPFIIKALFILIIQLIELLYKIIKSSLYTIWSLFTESIF